MRRLSYTKFCGVEFPITPATPEELGVGTAVVVDENYYQNENKFSPQQRGGLMLKKAHLRIAGPSGSGKDEWVLQLAAQTSTPLQMFNLNSEGDLSGLITRTTLKKEGGVTVTKEESGALRRACEGLKIHRSLESLTPDGAKLSKDEVSDLIREMKSHDWDVVETDAAGVYQITLPFLILVSDADRGSVEMLRQAIELGKEALTDPVTGDQFPIKKGTRFVFTANSGVDGDANRGMVVKPSETSMMNRMSHCTFPFPPPEVEKGIYSRRFPTVEPAVIEAVVHCTTALREVVREEMLLLEVSLRQGCSWIEHALDFSEFYSINMIAALKESFGSISGSCMLPENRALLEAAISPFLVERKNPITGTGTTKCPIDM